MSVYVHVISISSAKSLVTAYIRIYQGQLLVAELENQEGEFCFDRVARSGLTARVGAQGYVTRTLKVEDIVARRQVVLVEEGVTGYIGQSPLVAEGSNLTIYVQSSASWYCEIYRYSKVKTRIYTSELQKPVAQKLLDGDVSKVGLGWAPTLDINSGVLSLAGLYAVHLEDELGNRVCLPFVVNSREMTSDICVVANTSTWNMYNCWGGRSRYRNFVLNKGTGQEEETLTRRLKLALLRRLYRLRSDLHKEDLGFCIEPAWISIPLSLERPLVNMALSADSAETPYLDHLAGHEWRFLSWLENRGFSYDFVQDNYLSECQIDISKYKNIVLVGHSEYWQQKDFLALQDAYEKGANILNLSGNSLYQQVEYHGNNAVRVVRKGFKSTGEVKSIADYFSTDLEIKSFSPYNLKTRDSNSSSQAKVIGEKTLFDINILKRSRGEYNAHFPSQSGDQVSSVVGASGWEVDKIDERVRDLSVVVATGSNDGGGAEIFYIPAYRRGYGVFFSVSSIAFIASLPVDDDLTSMVVSVLEGNYPGA